MTGNPNDDFLKPLKNRPGLTPRPEFKDELFIKLKLLKLKRRSFSSIKVTFLARYSVNIIFSSIFNGYYKTFKW
jgi:hypothetical protein